MNSASKKSHVFDRRRTGARLLSTVRAPGDFHAAVADRAPDGRGGETRVDTAVRRTCQIGAGRVRIEGSANPSQRANRDPFGSARQPDSRRRPRNGSDLDCTTKKRGCPTAKRGVLR
jgi:hypothetical protein